MCALRRSRGTKATRTSSDMRTWTAVTLAALLVLAAVETCAQAPVPSDSFLDEVNAELDQNIEQSEAEPVQSEATPPTRGTLYYLRVLSMLCLVIGLILAIGYAVRRLGGSTPLLAGADLGRIMGRLYLSRNVTLFFVETGGKVLVLGVTGTSVATVAEFDASAFDTLEEEDTGEGAFDPESFLAQLQASSSALRQEASPAAADDDIASLRQDIERLQGYLREESREPQD